MANGQGLSRKLAQISRRLLRDVLHPRHHLLRQLKGVIHVGAHKGQERDDYAKYGFNVLWIEPIPWLFEELKDMISSYPNQRALEYLVLDRDDQTSTLHVSNNEGGSSSVMDLALHKDMWPSVRFTKDLEMRSYKLDTILEREHVDLSSYDGLILDTQGSELLILKGADRVLRRVKMVEIEVADFEAYAGCPNPAQIAEHLSRYGLTEWMRTPFARHKTSGGRYYDITYVRD